MPDPQMPSRSGLKNLVIIVLAVLLAVAAAFYFIFLPGFSVARNEPSKLEVNIATYLLGHSVPASAKAMATPLGAGQEHAGRRATSYSCQASRSLATNLPNWK